MDALKAKVAASVRNKVLELAGVLLLDSSMEKLPRTMSVIVATDLVTNISIRTSTGPRYFSVKVSEHWA